MIGFSPTAELQETPSRLKFEAATEERPHNVGASVDPRLAFLLIAAVHWDCVAGGGGCLADEFEAVCEAFDRIFPCLECCDSCGCAPCINPSFCNECRRSSEASNVKLRHASQSGRQP